MNTAALPWFGLADELAAPIAASGEIRFPNPMGSPRDVNT
jgi:hypothetical protein